MSTFALGVAVAIAAVIVSAVFAVFILLDRKQALHDLDTRRDDVERRSRQGRKHDRRSNPSPVEAPEGGDEDRRRDERRDEVDWMREYDEIKERLEERQHDHRNI